MVITRCLVVATEILVQGQNSKLPIRGGREAWCHRPLPLANSKISVRCVSPLPDPGFCALLLSHGATFEMGPTHLTGS